MNTNTSADSTASTHDVSHAEAHARASTGEGLGESIAGLGTAWARYGLRLGSVALENQSRHMEACGKALGEALAQTAKTLATIADTLRVAEPTSPATTPTDERPREVVEMPVSDAR